MQKHKRLEPSARVSATVAVIKRAIQDRACLSGKHVEFRVHFAPHVLGRDENGQPIVFGFEYGGLTLGRAHWVCFSVHRLRGLEQNGDPWRSGSVASRPQFGVAQVEAGVDDGFSLPIDRDAPVKGTRTALQFSEDRAR